MPSCPGCGRELSFTGVAKHLAQTQNQVCREIYDDVFRFEASSSAGSDEVRSFDGDFFGAGEDYMPSDFGGNRDDDEMDIDNEEKLYREDKGGNEDEDDLESELEEDEDELLVEEFDAGWEPARSQMADSEPVDDQSVKGDAPQTRSAAEEQDYNEPVIVKFPGNAGAPIAHVEAIGHHAYKQQISNAELCWAPFKSKIDWEIAKWAKLHGPGSTAFDDLLGIEGVSILLLFIFILTDLLYELP
jgi:hypothetical protein